MAYGLNLTNEVFGYYQGSTQFVNQREYYKPTYGGGLRYTFGSSPQAAMTLSFRSTCLPGMCSASHCYSDTL